MLCSLLWLWLLELGVLVLRVHLVLALIPSLCPPWVSVAIRSPPSHPVSSAHHHLLLHQRHYGRMMRLAADARARPPTA